MHVRGTRVSEDEEEQCRLITDCIFCVGAVQGDLNLYESKKPALSRTALLARGQ